MNSFSKLQKLLTELPGIGPKQAQRFAAFLLRKDERYIKELMSHLSDARSHMKVCTLTGMYFYTSDLSETLSPIARDPNRDKNSILVVEKDIDVERIEQSHAYNGLYFVLGGTIPVIESDPEKHIRWKELRTTLSSLGEKGMNEVILGLSANPEGEHTSFILKNSLLNPIKDKYGFSISVLGRGLSTGTELEYSDEDTIKSALANRS